MKRNFTNENFEDFIRENVDGLKMRPRARVWKGIASEINRPKRILIFSLLSLTLLSGGLFYTLNNTGNPHNNKQSILHHSGNVYTIANTLSQPATSMPLGGRNTAHLSIVQPRRIFTPFSLISNSGNFHLQVQHASPEPTTENANNQNGFVYNPGSYSDNERVMKAATDDNFRETKKMDLAYPLSIESVVNNFQKTKRSKTSIEFYLTPTVSYRKLQEHKNIIRSAGLLGISSYQGNSMYNINTAVTQKPDMGIEMGVALKHAIARNLKLRAGLQFNVNRYDVKVFNTPNQLSTIQLNNSSNPDYLNTITNYSNFNGLQSNWLQNFYFQVSAPVGLELKVKGDDNIQFGIASTIQPTYILGERAYLISSDYKTYAQVPGLLRHTNVNTSLETFVSYATHRYRWQVGPEVRYQVFSSFVQNYSVKEHLLDFGLKIGISPLK